MTTPASAETFRRLMELETQHRKSRGTPRRSTEREVYGAYTASLKSSVADELLNTYLIRPLAWLIVRPLLLTSARPEAVVGLNIVLASAAAGFFFVGTGSALMAAGWLLLAKIVLDAVDGQLARAKGLVSRLGRFLDSLGDFYTNLLIFLAIGLATTREAGDPGPLLLWFLCFWTMTLQCSVFNYYLVAHLRSAGKNTASRIDESLRSEDARESRTVRALQRLYLLTYGWQDRMVALLDRGLGADDLNGDARNSWYTDRMALRLSSFLGLGTLLTPLAALALLDRLDLYLLFIFGPCNLIVLTMIAYRSLLARRLAEDR